MKRDQDEEILLVTLAAAHPNSLAVEDLGRKAGRIGQERARDALGEMSLRGLVEGSGTTGFRLTQAGQALVEEKFERGKMRNYTSFAPRDPRGPKNPPHRAIPIVIGATLMLVALLLLSACATPARMHDVTELNAVGTRCGLALGELIQDESEKRVLIMLRPGATAEQRACVTQWAKRNSLKPVIVDAIQFPEGS